MTQGGFIDPDLEFEASTGSGPIPDPHFWL